MKIQTTSESFFILRFQFFFIEYFEFLLIHLSSLYNECIYDNVLKSIKKILKQKS